MNTKWFEHNNFPALIMTIEGNLTVVDNKREALYHLNRGDRLATKEERNSLFIRDAELPITEIR